MYYLDSHCHLNDVAYNDDRQLVLDHMAEAGVKKAMIVSCSVAEYQLAKTIVHDDIVFKHSLGVYPDDCELAEPFYQDYVLHMQERACVAIGEIGLDYHWHKDNKEAQKARFIAQIELAKALNKPIIVHSRDAAGDTYDILKAHRCPGVIHCYSGSAELAREFVRLGYYISFSGTITFKNAKEPLRALQEVPLNRLLVETDCPYLSPVPYRGKRNEPAYVLKTTAKIAEERGLDISQLLEQLNENYENLFRGENI